MSGRKVLREKVNGLLLPEDEVTALCNVYLSAASASQAIASGATFKRIKVFSDSSANIGVNIDYVNGEIELLEDGIYHVSYDMAIASSVVVTDFRAQIQSSSTPVRQSLSRISYISGAADEAVSLHGEAIHVGTAGQKISLNASHGFPSSATLTFYNLSLTIRKIGG